MQEQSFDVEAISLYSDMCNIYVLFRIFSLSLCCHASQSFLCFRSIPAQGDTNHVHCVTANLHLLLFYKLILVRRLQVLLTERVCVGALFVALQRRPLGVFLEQTHGLGVLYKMSVLFCQIKSAR
jgi:hypothetical protein